MDHTRNYKDLWKKLLLYLTAFGTIQVGIERFTTSNLIMRCYQDSKSITLNDDRKKEIKEKLISLTLVSKQVKYSVHEGRRRGC